MRSLRFWLAFSVCLLVHWWDADKYLTGSPILALSFLLGYYLGPRHGLGLLVAVFLVLVSEGLTAYAQGVYPIWWFFRIVCYVVIAQCGAIQSTLEPTGRALTWPRLMLCLFLSSTGFYFTTNTLSWMMSPDYAHTFNGWLQAVTVGLPGYRPAWTFYWQNLGVDLLYGLGITWVIETATGSVVPNRRIEPLHV